MRSLRRPTDGQLIEHLLQAAEQPLSCSSTPENLVVIQRMIPLGHGPKVYRRAVAQLLSWSSIPTDYVELFWSQRPLLPGTTVATGIWVRGFYWLNPCRIIDVSVSPGLDTCEPDASSESEPLGDSLARVVWHTIEGHSLIGEQSFSVLYNGETGEVSYDVTGTSEPAPGLRMHSQRIHLLRQKFAERSCASMQRALAGPAPQHLPAFLKSLPRGV